MREMTVSYKAYKNDKVLSRCKKTGYNPETKTASLELTEAQYLAYGIQKLIPQEEIARWVETDSSYTVYDVAIYYAQAYLDGDIDRDALCDSPIWCQEIVALMDRETGRTEDLIEAMDAIDAARIAANKINPTTEEAAHYADLKKAYDTLKTYQLALKKRHTIRPTVPFLLAGYNRIPNLDDLNMDQISAAYHLGKQLADNH